MSYSHRESISSSSSSVSYFIHYDWFLTVFNQIELIRTVATTKRNRSVKKQKLRWIKNCSRERDVFTLELWPLFEVFYFIIKFDGMIVVNLGVLLHPGHDDFERDQAGQPNMLCDELMNKNEQ